MKRRGMIALVMGALAFAAECEDQTQVDGPEYGGPTGEYVVNPTRGGRVPAGSTIWVALDERVSAKYNVPGDVVQAHVLQDVISPGGTMLIPAGSQVMGRIIQLED